MKKLSQNQIEALATTEAAIEYRATQDKWLHATIMIEEAINLDDYSKLNHDAMDWAVEILEDALDATYATHIHETEMKPLIEAHEAREAKQSI